MDYLRDLGTHMGSQGRREAGLSGFCQTTAPAVPRAGQSLVWCHTLHPAPVPSSSADNVPHIHGWGTSTAKTPLREGTFIIFKRAEARRHKQRQREVRNAKDTFGGKKSYIFPE